jgi:hypothetical protein
VCQMDRLARVEGREGGRTGRHTDGSHLARINGLIFLVAFYFYFCGQFGAYLGLRLIWIDRFLGSSMDALCTIAR